MPVLAAITATAATIFAWNFGHPIVDWIQSVVAPKNPVFALPQLILVVVATFVFSEVGRRMPVKKAALIAAAFSCAWFALATGSAYLLGFNLAPIPVCVASFATISVAHFSRLWLIDLKLTRNLVALGTVGNLASSAAPDSRVETGLLLLETIFPVSEVVVFGLSESGGLEPLGRARKDGNNETALKRNELWQHCVDLCDVAANTRETIVENTGPSSTAARIALPLICNDEVQGVLFIDIKHDFQQADKMLLETFAEQLARNFQRNSLKHKILPHSHWWSSFSTQSSENRLNITSLVDGLNKERSFGAVATSNLSEAHAVVYLDGTIAYLNNSIRELAGIESEDVANIDLFSLLDRFRTLVFNDPSIAIRRVLQTGKPFSCELLNDESNRELQLDIIPVRAEFTSVEGQPETDRPSCLLITVKNIAERKENERLRSDMANLMSHELRTPITSINGFAEMLLLDGSIPEDSREYLSIISSESKRASALLSNFLSVANLEQSDKKEIEKLPVKVDKVVREVVEEMHDTAKKKRIRIVEKQSDYIPPVAADRGLISRAIGHLLDNAIRYSPERTSVVISTVLEADFLRVDVEDRGYGIPKGEQEKIWQKFYRVSRDGVDKQEETTGLGLSLVKEIVEQHHGKISVASAVGRGSRFTLRIPRL
ncbi:MAG: ATP-binding protein [Pyrinomonadaceae bacterium]